MIIVILAAGALQASPIAAKPADAAPPPAAAARRDDPDKVVCATEKEIGSLFSHRVCVRKSVIDERRQNDREILDRNQRGPSVCPPGVSC